LRYIANVARNVAADIEIDSAQIIAFGAMHCAATIIKLLNF